VATTAVGGLTAALGKITIDAAPVEGLSNAFDGLAASADQGSDELLDALQRGSAGMIAQRDLMMSFNKAASLVSTDFAVQLPEAMEYLGKVSASTGQDLDFLLDSLVMGVGRISPMILDNLSIQVSQAEATERAAQMFAVEAEALSKTQQQAGMMNVVMEKLAANTASMPDVTDSAAAGLARMRAKAQNLADRVGSSLLPALGNILGAFDSLSEQVLPPVIGLIEDRLAPNVITFTDHLSELIGVVPDLIRYFRHLWIEGDYLNDYLGRMPDFLQPIIERIGELITRINPYIDLAADWIARNVSLQDVLIVLGAAITSIVIPAISSIVATVAPAIAVFAALLAAVATLRQAWVNDFLGIRSTLTDVWENTIWPTLVSLSGWLRDNVPAAIEILRTKIGQLRDRFLDLVAPLQDGVLPFLASLYERIKTGLANVDWLGIGSSILQWIGEGVIAGYDIVSTWFVGVKDRAVTFFQETDWQMVGETIWGKITDGISSTKDAILGSDAATQIRDTLGKLFTPTETDTIGDQSGVMGFLDKLAGWINGPGGKVISVVGTIIGLLTGLGAPIALVIGTIKLLSMAWQNDFGGVRELVTNVGVKIQEFAENTQEWFGKIKDTVMESGLMNVIQTVITFVETHAIPAIQTFGNAFMEHLQPHLEEAWDILQVFPDALGPEVQEAVEGLKAVWDTLSKVFVEQVIPALERLGINFDTTGAGLGEFVGIIITYGVVGLLYAIKGALDAITLAMYIVEDIIQIAGITFATFTLGLERLIDVAGDVGETVRNMAGGFEDLTGLELPDWLMPGSPTPFETGLRGIGNAMRDLSGMQMPQMTSEMSQMYNQQMVGEDRESVNQQVVIYGGITIEGGGQGKGNLLSQLQELTI
jgi:hypothetical protein